MDDLRDLQLDGKEIFTRSDVSYREKIKSSTYGFAIMTHDQHLSYATGKKIEVQSTKASALRMDLEGLITTYEIHHCFALGTYATTRDLPLDYTRTLFQRR